MEPYSQLPTTKKVRLADLLRLPDFQTLTDKQQSWCALYCASGFLTGRYDAGDCATKIYKTKNAASAAALGAQLLGQRKIRTVLDLHFGRNALDGLLADLKRAVKRGLRRGNKKFVVITPEVASALLIFEAYVSAEGNVHE